MSLIDEITIGNNIVPGILDFIIDMHGEIYKKEYGYTDEFKTIVAEGLISFYKDYNSTRERVWVCEHKRRIVGFLLLADKGNQAQLRFFLIDPLYRGIGLGNKLLHLFFKFFHECGYESAFLWTTRELETAAHLYMKFNFILAEEIDSERFGKPVTEQKYVFRKTS